MMQDEEIESLLESLAKSDIDWDEAKKRLQRAGFTDVRVVGDRDSEDN